MVSSLNVLTPGPTHPSQSRRWPQHRHLCHLQLCLFSLCMLGDTSGRPSSLTCFQGSISHIRLDDDHSILDGPRDDNMDGMIRLMTDLLKKYTSSTSSPVQIHHLEGVHKGEEREREKEREETDVWYMQRQSEVCLLLLIIFSLLWKVQ